MTRDRRSRRGDIHPHEVAEARAYRAGHQSGERVLIVDALDAQGGVAGFGQGERARPEGLDSGVEHNPLTVCRDHLRDYREGAPEPRCERLVGDVARGVRARLQLGDYRVPARGRVSVGAAGGDDVHIVPGVPERDDVAGKEVGGGASARRAQLRVALQDCVALVAHDARELHSVLAGNDRGEVEALGDRARAASVHADVDLDDDVEQPVGAAGGLPRGDDPFETVDREDRPGIRSQPLQQIVEPLGGEHLVGDESLGDTGVEHGARLDDGRRRHADRAGGHLSAREVDATEVLHVGSQGDWRRLSGHEGEVVVDGVEVQEQGRRRQALGSAHPDFPLRELNRFSLDWREASGQGSAGRYGVHNDDVRVAVVGCGYIAPWHAAGWATVAGARIVAVADPDASAAARVLAAHAPEARHYRSLEELLAREHPDVVDILSPPRLHDEHCRAALAARTTTVCQKPLVDDLERARRLVDDFASAGVGLVVHENHVYRPWFADLVRRYRSGALGAALMLRIEQFDSSSPPQVANRVASQGVLLQYGIHLLDLAIELLGPPTRVEARLARANDDLRGESHAFVNLGYSEQTVEIGAGWKSGGLAHGGLVLLGSLGEAHYDGTLTRGPTARWRVTHGAETVVDERREPDADYADSFAALQRDVAAAVRGAGPLPQPAARNLVTLATTFAAYAAAERGEPVELDEFIDPGESS